MNADKLELIELTKYACPICKSVYNFENEAEKCLSKGIIGEGPEIKPGLVIKNLYTDGRVCSIFMGESMDEHFRKDEFLHFERKYKRKNIFSKIKTLDSLNYYQFDPLEDGNFRRNFINWIKSNIQLLDESEFQEFKDFVDKHPNSSRFTKETVYTLNNLYRYHSYFDKNQIDS